MIYRKVEVLSATVLETGKLTSTLRFAVEKIHKKYKIKDTHTQSQLLETFKKRGQHELEKYATEIIFVGRLRLCSHYTG